MVGGLLGTRDAVSLPLAGPNPRPHAFPMDSPVVTLLDRGRREQIVDLVSRRATAIRSRITPSSKAEMGKGILEVGSGDERLKRRAGRSVVQVADDRDGAQSRNRLIDARPGLCAWRPTLPRRRPALQGD